MQTLYDRLKPEYSQKLDLCKGGVLHELVMLELQKTVLNKLPYSAIIDLHLLCDAPLCELNNWFEHE